MNDIDDMGSDTAGSDNLLAKLVHQPGKLGPDPYDNPPTARADRGLLPEKAAPGLYDRIVEGRDVRNDLLCDPLVFEQVSLDPEIHTLVWPNRADFDPATLHD